MGHHTATQPTTTQPPLPCLPCCLLLAVLPIRIGCTFTQQNFPYRSGQCQVVSTLKTPACVTLSWPETGRWGPLRQRARPAGAAQPGVRVEHQPRLHLPHARHRGAALEFRVHHAGPGGTSSCASRPGNTRRPGQVRLLGPSARPSQVCVPQFPAQATPERERQPRRHSARFKCMTCPGGAAAACTGNCTTN